MTFGQPSTLHPDAANCAPDDVINVAFGIDPVYAPHVATTIASVRRHAPGAVFQFFIFHDGVPAQERARVQVSAPDALFVWVEITEEDVLALSGRDHISRATFYRLALPRLTPANVRRIIYLDSDLVVARDLRRLWATDLEGAPIGAVCDSGMAWRGFADAYGLDHARGPYFNAGVLLIDLDRVRAEGVFNRALEFLQSNTFLYMDQDALNLALWGRWKPLDPVWNVQHTMLLGDAAEGVSRDMLPNGRRPAIIHYTGRRKPWLIDGYHPFAWRYWQALKRTDYFHEVAQRYRVTFARRIRLYMRYAAHWTFLRA